MAKLILSADGFILLHGFGHSSGHRTRDDKARTLNTGHNKNGEPRASATEAAPVHWNCNTIQICLKLSDFQQFGKIRIFPDRFQTVFRIDVCYGPQIHVGFSGVGKMLAVVIFAMLFAVLLSVGIGVVCFLSVACRPNPLETVETQPSRLFEGQR